MIEPNLVPILEAMDVSVERKAYELGSMIRLYGALITEKGDANFSARLSSIEKIADDGLRLEIDCGRWSQLDLDHPVTRKMLARGSYDRIPEVTSRVASPRLPPHHVSSVPRQR